jgi:hypothetical protein
MNLTPEEKEENDQVGITIGVGLGVVLALIFSYYTSSEWPNLSTKSELITRVIGAVLGGLLWLVDDEPLAFGFANGWLWTLICPIPARLWTLARSVLLGIS